MEQQFLHLVLSHTYIPKLVTPYSVWRYFRSVWESVDTDKFQERLDTRIKQHDREIERMCNYHYQGFIESVRSLLQVRTEVGELKVG